ncbi:DUF4097 family beta strand repeat-containing protein [Streptomyces sp. NBRC 109706]|uniref:DUF4097 family beta strand repeat-containing protein n=1 Tax=Streptomyces sp. NBRC 109706 TaxID=1550035 RepID=UPI0007816A20|nr:DUF4097 family beta strand repeat-containing protein [Streptomyces sp. NBRC 109706]
MTIRTLTANTTGPITIDAHLLNHPGTITVRATPQCTRATLTIRTSSRSGPAADIVRTATLRQDGARLIVRAINNSHATRHHARNIINPASSGAPTIQADTINGAIHLGGSQATLTATAPQQPAPITIDVTVPENSSVTARTNSADITIAGTITDATAATQSGHIHIERAANTSAKTHLGNITLGHTQIADANTRSGDINILNASGHIWATTESGDIAAHATAECGITADTRSGDITITATAPAIAARLSVRTRTKSGRVRIPQR